MLTLLACGSPVAPDDGDVVHSLLAVGDVGRTTRLQRLLEGQIAVAHGMTAEHERRPVSELLLLGDNFYWSGLSNENVERRLRLNVALPYCAFIRLAGPRSSALRTHCDDPGGDAVEIFAVLGNHDLRGKDSVHLQREVVPEFVSNWHMPNEFVERVELGDGISLILLESELMLTEELTLEPLTAALAAAPGPWRIVAAHRPIGMGERGAPARGGFPALVLAAIRAAGVPVQLYLAGHEHNLQLLTAEAPGDPGLTVIAGSGSRASTPIGPPLPTTFFAAQEMGFARVDLVRRERGERMIVSLFASPRFPFLAWGAPELVARVSVGLDGRVENERVVGR